MSVESAVGAKGPTRPEIRVREHRLKSFLNLLIPVSRECKNGEVDSASRLGSCLRVCAGARAGGLNSGEL